MRIFQVDIIAMDVAGEHQVYHALVCSLACTEQIHCQRPHPFLQLHVDHEMHKVRLSPAGLPIGQKITMAPVARPNKTK